MPQPNAKVIDFLQAAARLRLEISGRNETLNFKNKKKGNFVIYAVDTDIVTCYSAPSMTGPLKRDGQNGYGYIFPGDEKDEDAQTGLTSVLAEYIFEDLETDLPMLQLPTQHDETDRVYRAVARKTRESRISRSVLEKNAQKIEKIVDEAYRELKSTISQKNADNTSSIIHKTAQKILEFIRKLNAPVEELRRYFILKAMNCALTLKEGMALFNSSSNKLYVQIADALEGAFNREGTEHLRYHQLCNLWMARIGSQKSSLISKERFSTDAEALATLDIINQRLEPLGGRMILITGDRSVIAASRERIQFAETKEFSRHYFSEFSKKYVRHFHAFLSDCLVDESATRVDSWLDGFLGVWKEGQEDTLLKIASDRNKAEEAVGKFELNDESINKLLEEWTGFKHYAVEWLLIKKEDDIEHDQSDKLEGVKDKLDLGQEKSDLIRSINEFASNTKRNLWDQFVDELTLTGTEFLFLQEAHHPRNSPDVRFDSLKHSEKVFQCLTSGAYRADPDKFEADLGGVAKDTLNNASGQNALGYLRYVIFSCAFAQDSKWETALTLVQRAIDIVENNPPLKIKTGSNISGREAYYVAACATRILARNSEEIAEACSLIDKAQNALDKDHEKDTASKIRGIRFDIERLAIELSSLYLVKFKSASETRDVTETLPLSDLQTKSIEIWRRCLLQNDEDDFEIKSSTLANIAVNCLQILALQYEQQPDRRADFKVQFKSLVKEWVNTIDETTYEEIQNSQDISAPARRSFLIKSYLIFGQLLLGKSGGWNLHFTETEIKTGSVTIYDENRFEWLRSQCEKLEKATKKGNFSQLPA